MNTTDACTYMQNISFATGPIASSSFIAVMGSLVAYMGSLRHITYTDILGITQFLNICVKSDKNPSSYV